jgi:hypothetical protein
MEKMEKINLICEKILTIGGTVVLTMFFILLTAIMFKYLYSLIKEEI